LRIKTSSCKAKARVLQNHLAEELRIKFPEVAADLHPQLMGGTGEDIVMGISAQNRIPYSFECKNQEKLNIWAAVEQAVANSKGRTPVVVFKRNRSKIYAVIELKELIKLI